MPITQIENGKKASFCGMSNPVTRNYAHFEDLYKGQVIRLKGITLTREMITDFATRFDPLPFHLDEKAAQASLLGGLCASGWQTCALSLRMVLDAFPSKLASAGGVGFTDLKWKKPVMLNDTIAGQVTITKLRRSRSRPEWGIITLDFDIRNQRNEQVLTMTSKNLVDVRDPSAGFEERKEEE